MNAIAAAPLFIMPNVSVVELLTWKRTLPPEILKDYGRFFFTLSGYITAAFTSREWVETHMISNTLRGPGHKGYFQMEFDDDLSREKKSLRMFELAEVLLNLQLVEGFYECVERLKTGDEDQIEATLAELEFAKLLYLHNLDFKFVVPDKAAGGRNYDFEFRLNSHPVVCADAKCKLESTKVGAESVKTTLAKGRSQLPKDKPGIVYVKVPQHWFDDKTMADELRRIARDFLRSTERIVQVCFYISHVTMSPERQQMLHQHAFDEIQNPNAGSRFAPRDWRLFKNFTPPDDWVMGFPPTWIALKRFWP